MSGPGVLGQQVLGPQVLGRQWVLGPRGATRRRAA
jgi:hypothetical protein